MIENRSQNCLLVIDSVLTKNSYEKLLQYLLYTFIV